MDWAEYVNRKLATADQAELAERADISQGAISRWANSEGGLPRVENMIKFARAMGDSPVAVLVQVGVFTADEVAGGAVQLDASLRDLDPEALILELARRLGARVTADTKRRRRA